MDLSNLQYAPGSRKKSKRIGRGEGSGHGGTSTKGNKGLKSRSGAHMKAWFEGGQMPLQRRLPKYGFVNLFRVEYQTLNLGALHALKGSRVDVKTLFEAGLVARKDQPVKLLGNGEVRQAFDVEVHAITDPARAKIEKAGGKVQVLGIRKTRLEKKKRT
jgi:large subunit ribosomal protein L15